MGIRLEKICLENLQNLLEENGFIDFSNSIKFGREYKMAYKKEYSKNVILIFQFYKHMSHVYYFNNVSLYKRNEKKYIRFYIQDIRIFSLVIRFSDTFIEKYEEIKDFSKKSAGGSNLKRIISRGKPALQINQLIIDENGWRMKRANSK